MRAHSRQFTHNAEYLRLSESAELAVAVSDLRRLGRHGHRASVTLYREAVAH
jgi:hypothetical protein